MTLKATVRANTTIKGTITESSDERIFLDVFEEAVISSLDERSMMRRMAIRAPPIPTLRAVVMDIALETAVVLEAVLVTVTIVESMLP